MFEFERIKLIKGFFKLYSYYLIIYIVFLMIKKRENLFINNRENNQVFHILNLKHL